MTETNHFEQEPHEQAVVDALPTGSDSNEIIGSIPSEPNIRELGGRAVRVGNRTRLVKTKRSNLVTVPQWRSAAPPRP